MTEDRALYFDDLHIGQKFSSATHVMDRGRMLAFAEEFDPQPFHLGSGESLLESMAASGWYTAALTQKLLVSNGLPLAKGMVGLTVEVRWPNASNAGDTIRVETEITSLRASRSKPTRGIVTIESLTLTADDRVIQHQIATIMVERANARN